jgi:hypothetical protein
MFGRDTDLCEICNSPVELSVSIEASEEDYLRRILKSAGMIEIPRGQRSHAARAEVHNMRKRGSTS